VINVLPSKNQIILLGEKKKEKQIVPDKWKKGSRNITGGRCGGRKIGANMLL
jgi:hypothetical protein